MPYTPSTVPPQKNTKSAEQKKVFAKVFDEVLARTGSEATAFKEANAAASRVGTKKGTKG